MKSLSSLRLAALIVQNQRQHGPCVAPLLFREPDRFPHRLFGLGQSANLAECLAQTESRRVGRRVFSIRVFPKGQRGGPYFLPFNAGHAEQGDSPHAADESGLAHALA